MDKYQPIEISDDDPIESDDNILQIAGPNHYVIPNIFLSKQPSERRKKSKRQKKNKRIRNKRDQQQESVILHQIKNVPRDIMKYKEKFNKETINFVDFCINRSYFINENLDVNNIYSVLLTRLPETFYLINNTESVKKYQFIECFKYKNYYGDLNDIFKSMDIDNDGIINFADFFAIFLIYVLNSI